MLVLRPGGCPKARGGKGRPGNVRPRSAHALRGPALKASGSRSTWSATPLASGTGEGKGGWDAVGWPGARSRFTGRVGHVTVSVVQHRLGLPVHTLAALAARVRDRIPDRPAGLPQRPRFRFCPSGSRPLQRLSAAEAEEVLGNG